MKYIEILYWNIMAYVEPQRKQEVERSTFGDGFDEIHEALVQEKASTAANFNSIQ